jgi:DNA-binding MarR family transcriptional regulator
MRSDHTLLQREIRQSRPFRGDGHEAAVGLLLTADRVRRSLAAVVEPHGITLQQYNVLRILRGAGEAGLPTLEIGERMIERSPGVTRLLDRLEAKGLVRRERCPTDRRQVFCRIEPPGLELLVRLDPPVDEADAASIAKLAPAECQQLFELLAAVRAGYDQSRGRRRRSLPEPNQNDPSRPITTNEETTP